MATITVPVDGLTCRRCVETVTEQITGLDGVSTVSVDLVTGGTSTVTVEADRELTDAEIQQTLTEGGAFTVAR